MKNTVENRIKWLEFIQNIITYNNTNSFQIKFMLVTIVAAILAIYLDNNCELILVLAVFVTFVFWFLDAKYLQQERQFRGLYSDVLENKKNIKIFSMPINMYKGGRYSYF